MGMTNGPTAQATVQLRADAVSWREVDGEIVALDLAVGDYLAINATGVTVWTALADGTTERRLGDLLIERYDISRSRADDDVASFLGALEARGLVCRSP